MNHHDGSQGPSQGPPQGPAARAPRKLLLAAGLLLGLGWGVSAPAADPAALQLAPIDGIEHALWQPVQAPLPPAIEGADPVLILMCRLGAADGSDGGAIEQPTPPLPQDLPVICLMVKADAQAVHLGPARFHELLDTAARSGNMQVLLVPPESQLSIAPD